MKAFSLRRSVPLLIHVLGWFLLGFILLLYQPLTWRIDVPLQFWVKQGVLFSMLVALFYLNARVFVPRLLLKGYTVQFILAMVASVTVTLAIIRAVEVGLNLPELMAQAFNPDRKPGTPLNKRYAGRWLDVFTMLTTLFVLMLSTSITAVQKWQADAELRQALEQEKTLSELSFLKAQINPHFFFNTLNNIYSLTLLDVDKAREALHRLSRMMRYVLYETKNSQMQLSQEIAFIKDYLELMQLRLTTNVTVTFDCPEAVRDQSIAPMILLPFIENAFKHGISNRALSHIHITLRQSDGYVFFEVRNSIFKDKGSSLDESSGIGLVNTRRRLDLLYHGRYMLVVNEETPDNEFLVQLTVSLSEVALSRRMPVADTV